MAYSIDDILFEWTNTYTYGAICYVDSLLMEGTPVDIDALLTKEDMSCSVLLDSEIEEVWNRCDCSFVDITIDHTKISENLTDYPLFLPLSSSCGTNSWNAAPIFNELRLKAPSDTQINDSFEGTDYSPINSDLWEVYDPNNLFSIRSNSLHFEGPTTPASIVYSTLTSKYELVGDFDVTISLNITSFPQAVGYNQYSYIDYTKRNNAICVEAFNESTGTASRVSRFQTFNGSGWYTNGCGFTNSNRGSNPASFYNVTNSTGQFSTGILKLRRMCGVLMWFFYSGGVWYTPTGHDLFDYFEDRYEVYSEDGGAYALSYEDYLQPLRIKVGVIQDAGSAPIVADITSFESTFFTTSKCYNLSIRSSNNEALPVCINRWDDTSSGPKVWLFTKVPFVSSTEDTKLRLYYNPDKNKNFIDNGFGMEARGKFVWSGDEYQRVFLSHEHHQNQCENSMYYSDCAEYQAYHNRGIDDLFSINREFNSSFGYAVAKSVATYIKIGPFDEDMFPGMVLQWVISSSDYSTPGAYFSQRYHFSSDIRWAYFYELECFSSSSTITELLLGFDGRARVHYEFDDSKTNNETYYYTLVWEPATHPRLFRNGVELNRSYNPYSSGLSHIFCGGNPTLYYQYIPPDWDTPNLPETPPLPDGTMSLFIVRRGVVWDADRALTEYNNLTDNLVSYSATIGSLCLDAYLIYPTMEFPASIVADSAVSSADINLTMALVTSISASSGTSSIIIEIWSIFASSVSAVSSTSAVDLLILVSFPSDIYATSALSEIDVIRSASLTSSIFPISQLSTIDLEVLREFLTSINGSSSTPNLTLILDFLFSISINAESVIASVEVDAFRKLLRSVIAISALSEITLHKEVSLESMSTTWGEQYPLGVERVQPWNIWKKSTGDNIEIAGSLSWGKVAINAGESIVSNVLYAGIGSHNFRAFSDLYGTGFGAVTLNIRGSTNSFSQLSETPVWEEYIGPINRSWTYVQLKISG